MCKEETETIQEMFNKADGAWTDVDWHQPFEANANGMSYDVIARSDLDLAIEEQSAADEIGVDRLPESFLSALHDAFYRAVKYARVVEDDAAEAQKAAENAMFLYAQGNIIDAKREAHRAAELEREYGDAPTWGRLSDALADLSCGFKG